MSKMRALLVGAMASGALAAGAFIPAHAQDVPVPGVATVKADGDPTGPSGYVIVQGESDDVPSIGHGYIGVDSNQGVVGCANGTYDPAGTNNAILDPAAPPAVPPSTSGPCTPAAP